MSGDYNQSRPKGSNFRAGYRWHSREEKVSRFWSLIDKRSVSGCWIWTGMRDKNGYGRFTLEGKPDKSHRVAWRLINNRSIPDGMMLLHSCDTPSCVNPEHLRLGTNVDNMRDMVSRGRSLAGDLNPSRTHMERMPRGEANRRSKLTEPDIHEIRRLSVEGHSNSSIARQFHVWPNCIRQIVTGKGWRHVPKKQHQESLRYELILDGAVRKYPSGREVCQNNTAGRREYERRLNVMIRRQNWICCLCPETMNSYNATFEHRCPRGMAAARRDDRIEDEGGNPINGAAHWKCNGEKGSKRI